MHSLPLAIQAEKSNAEGDKDLISAEDLGNLLSRAYSRVDREFASSVRPAFRLGFEGVARVGACALTVALTDDHIVVANAGDCRAVLAVAEDGKASSSANSTAIDLSRDHNARMPEEKERLAMEHPGESDIVLCKHPKACYVKGRLQPTRSLGDLFLKLSEFNGVPGDRSRGRYLRPPYTAPYIHSEPELTVRARSHGDRFVVLASDGLWDAMTSEEVVAFVDGLQRPDSSGQVVERKLVASRLVREALTREAATGGMPLRRLLEIPAGRGRRNLHDDITAVVVFLDGDGGAGSGEQAGAGGTSWLGSILGLGGGSGTASK